MTEVERIKENFTEFQLVLSELQIILNAASFSLLDDFGLQRFDHASRGSPLEVIEDRHGKHSTIITSQPP